MIKILFFAQLRDIAQTDSVEIPIGDMRVARDLLNGLIGHVPTALIDELRDESAMISIDQQYAEWGAELSDDVEVGILPPVSGG